MKIDFVLTSVNDNSYYYNLYPFIQKVWKEKFNLDLICIFIGNEIPEILKIYQKNIILFKPIENINPIYISQVIRILYPALFENKNILITDMDIIPISKSYFFNHLKDKNENCFITYTDRYVKQKMYAICYNLANSKVWKEIFNIHNLKDIQTFLINNYNQNYNGLKNCPGWYSDQKLLYKYLNNYKDLIVFNDKELNYKRLDGKGAVKLKYILDNIDIIINNIHDYSDFHIIRNYHKYLHIIQKIIDKILSI